MTLGLILLAGLLVRLVVATWLFPGFDEAYYYLYSRHLDWSYFDHPPLVALTTGVGWWLTGVISPLTIRLGALGLHVLSLLLLYGTAAWMFAPGVGRLAVAIATLIPLFAIGFGILTSPDNGLICFWSATLLVAAWEFFPRFPRAAYRPTWRLSLLGLTVGLACLSKYHGFVLALSLVAFCLTSPRYRRVFRSPWLLVAFGLFGLTLSPLLLWNLQHDWISFRFQLSMRFNGGEPTQFRPLQFIGYGFIHIAYLFPAFGVPLWWVTLGQWLQLGHRRLTKQSPTLPAAAVLTQKRILVLWLSLPITLGFTLLGGFQQILPAWPAPGFWGLTLLLAEQAYRWRQGVRRWLWGSAAVLLPLTLIALLHITTGTFQQPGRYALLPLLPPSQDPSIELIDVTQLRRRLAQSDAVIQALASSAFVFTNEYYLGGYLAMALHPLRLLPVTCFSQDPRGFAFWFDQAQWLGQDALYMTLERFDQQPDITEQYRSQFRRWQYLDAIPLKRGGVEVETIHIYQGQGFSAPYLYPYP